MAYTLRCTFSPLAVCLVWVSAFVALLERARKLFCRLLVLEATTDETRIAELRKLAERAACDVLVAR